MKAGTITRGSCSGDKCLCIWGHPLYQLSYAAPQQKEIPMSIDFRTTAIGQIWTLNLIKHIYGVQKMIYIFRYISCYAYKRFKI